MSPARRSLILAGALVASLSAAAPARASSLDRGTAEAVARAAITDGRYAFCASPSKPLSRSAERLCPLASEIEGCEGFARVCAEAKEPIKPPSWWSESLAKALGYLAMGVVWLALVVAVVAIVVAVVRVVRRSKEDEALREGATRETVVGIARAALATTTSDAEHLLQVAREHAAAGRFDLALSAYLGAALRALDDRGAVRIARHKTHGEYVRACADVAVRTPLREIVIDVDAAHFGGVRATAEAVDRAAARATAIVGPRLGPQAKAAAATLATMALLIVTLGACSGGILPRGTDRGVTRSSWICSRARGSPRTT